MTTPMRRGGVMEEAIRLSADGELGNSDAIHLLQIPHTSEELLDVVRKFDRVLTPQAKGKLTLEAFAPLPEHAQNQRFEPIFDKYPISGRTYTTAHGTVALNEVQYYNGQMLQVYGECTNLAGVRVGLAGSGYKPMTLKYADGRETTLAHFWSHHLSDTSLKPYNAMFFIIAAVPDDVPAHEASIQADDNGASSVLSVIDGTYDAAAGMYTNKARFYYVRLLDSTQVAIDVGRERMGLDKRLGSIELTHTGQRLGILVNDESGHVVAQLNIMLTDDPNAYLPMVAQAAATAGIRFTQHPTGTEHVYPGVARIGDGPMVHWAWHTDVLSRLQAVAPNSIVFDATSEIGALLHDWDFNPQVLGFIPNIRGAITGLAVSSTRRPRVRIKQPDSVGSLKPS